MKRKAHHFTLAQPRPQAELISKDCLIEACFLFYLRKAQEKEEGDANGY